MKCKNCVTHPELRQSGWPEPKDYICPVCSDYYDGKSKRRTEDLKLEEEEKKKQHDKAHEKYMQEKFAKGLQDHLKDLNKPGAAKKIIGGFHQTKKTLTQRSLFEE